MKRLLLLTPITLLLGGCNNLVIVECNYPQKTGEIIQESDKQDYCFPIFETCIDNYFNDTCSEIYKSGHNILCTIKTGSTTHILPIRTFRCNVCSGNYGIPINL